MPSHPSHVTWEQLPLIPGGFEHLQLKLTFTGPGKPELWVVAASVTNAHNDDLLWLGQVSVLGDIADNRKIYRLVSEAIKTVRNLSEPF